MALGLATVLGGCGLAAADPVSSTASAARTFVCNGPRTAATNAAAVTPIATNPQSSLPVTITDFSGERVTITDTSRILALDSYGTLATTVYALGLGDRLVGRDVSTGLPALAALPIVTHNGHELNAEAILALNPTVILTDYSIGPLEVQLQLRDAGIPVVILDAARSRATTTPQINEVAKVLGIPATGTALASHVATQTAAAEAEVRRLAPSDLGSRPRIVFLYMRGQAGVYYWFGRGSGADDLIAALGAVDVAGETGLKGEQPLSAEGLIKAAPDLYLMMSGGLSSVGGIDGLLTVSGVADTVAGRSRCVVDMPDQQILGFGPQFPATLSALAHAVYGTSAGAVS